MRKTDGMARATAAIAALGGVVLLLLAYRAFGVYAPFVVAVVLSALVLASLAFIVAKHALCRS